VLERRERSIPFHWRREQLSRVSRAKRGYEKDAIDSLLSSKGRFAEFDSNADGFVTMSEMFSLLETMDVVGRLPAGYNSAETHFKRLDDDGDGQVSWDEFEKHA
jgi:hypothetical protein